MIASIMLSPYIGIVILSIFVAGFVITMLAMSFLLGPKNPTRTKQLPFECGSVSVGDVKNQRFNVRFYLVAMLFIVFDIEVVFMYPWAVTLMELGWPGYFSMLSFVVILGFGLVYVWKKGVLDWNT